MSCITEIQGTVVIVIIWLCDLQLHMSYYWNTRSRRTTTATCISVIHDICSCKSHNHMITTKMAPCISVIYDICSCKSHLIWWCYLQLHMLCITEIQEAVVVVIIWWCDLQLHMSYITEIQGAILVVIIWFCDLQLHLSCITEIHLAVVVVIIWDHDGPLYFSNTWHM
jgi:hypothetical protein